MQFPFPSVGAARTAKPLALTLLALLSLAAPGRVGAVPAADRLALPGHIPPAEAWARPVDRLSQARQIPLALTLPLRHQDELNDLLRGLSDPRDPRFGKFLTPGEFAARFSPTPAEYSRVIDYAQSLGLTVVATHPNRTVLDVVAPAGQVERAFGLRLLVFRALGNGRYFYGPDAEPLVPAGMASLVSGVVGLDNAALWHPHLRSVADAPSWNGLAGPLQTGSGLGGGLAPSDIRAAYGLSGVTLNGSGQALGLFELDGYNPNDVSTYLSHYGLPAVPLQNVLVDGYSGAAGSGAGEVTLDIELQAALAPGASKIVVYEGPNSGAGVVDTYNRIAADNLVKQISTSWGEAENSAPASVRSSENAAFQQMAAQGQSIFAAAGDSGAYDNGSSLSVDDPASQPYVTGVGGTSLATSGPGGAWQNETVWNGGSVSAGAGGGGISTVWSIPSYQSGFVSAASHGSTTMRNVPDVSLDADPNTGYSIYFNGGWTIYGGTSCAAPLWAAFTALVNQNRVANGRGTLGFANTSLYTIASQSAKYASDFHDIADGSTNLYYPAVPGYDDAVGLGTFNGAALLADLSGGNSTPSAPAAPTGLNATAGSAQVSLNWTASAGATSYNVYRSTSSGTETLSRSGVTGASYTDTSVTNGTAYYYEVTAVNSTGESARSGEVSAQPQASTTTRQLLGNPGFENGSASPSPWSVTAGVIDNSASEPAHSGSWKAWLDGYGTTHTDTLAQTVSIPATVTTATLSFYLHIDTAESLSRVYDTLKVQVRSASGAVLSTLATYSNVNAAAGYSLKTFDVSSFRGQTIQVYLIGQENSSRQTSFVVDDFALNAR